MTSFDGLGDRDDVKTVYYHDRAAETIKAMFTRCELIHQTFGCGPEYHAAVISLHACLAKLPVQGFGRRCYVYSATLYGGGLSLEVNEDDRFVFGIVWFRDQQYDGTERADTAGEWSVHS